MNLLKRRLYILNKLATSDFVSVAELSSALNVSKVTIRQDLAYLESEGKLIRTHGGAESADKKSMLKDITNSLKADSIEKVRIAKAALQLIKPNDTVIIDSGTTAVQVTNLLEGLNVTIVTPSLLAMNASAAFDSVKLMAIGGMLDKETMSTTGALTSSSISQIHASLLFLDVTAYNENGLFTSSLRDSDVKHSMMRSAETVVLLADSSKYNQSDFSYLSSWDPIDIFITDKIDENLKKILSIKNIKVIIA